MDPVFLKNAFARVGIMFGTDALAMEVVDKTKLPVRCGNGSYNYGCT